MTLAKRTLTRLLPLAVFVGTELHIDTNLQVANLLETND